MSGGTDGPGDPPIDRAFEDPGTITDADRAALVDAFGTPRGTEAADALCALAEHDPAVVPAIVEAVAPALSDDDRGVRGTAARALADLAEDRPGDVAVAAPALSDRLADESDAVARSQAARALALIASAEPEAATPAIDALPALLRDDAPNLREYGASIAAAVSGARPGGAASLVPALTDAVAEPFERSGEHRHELPAGLRDSFREQEEEAAWRHATVRGEAATALAAIAGERPDALADAAPRLVAVLESAGNPLVRNPTIDAVGAIARGRPDLVADAIDPLADLLDADADDVRAAAAWTLGLLAEDYGERVAEAVHPSVDAAVDLLDAGHPRRRGAGASLLMYVAEHDPDAVAPATDTLRERLDDEAAYVRGSAAWALAEVGGAASRDRLATLAEDDPDEEVRNAARRAVAAIDERRG